VHDVGIVGAGPAGSACAISLLQRRRDLSVVIIDRDILPRAKSCGDLISPVARARLSALGLEVNARWRATEHMIASPSGVEDAASQEPESPWLQCRVVERRDFDLALLDQARALGASVMQGSRFLGARETSHGWALRMHGSVAQVGILVGADGATSHVARSIGCPAPAQGAVALRGYAVITRGGVPWTGTRMDFLPSLLPGYGWAFSVDETGRANIGVGRGVREAREEATSLHDVLAAYLAHLRGLGFDVSPVDEVRGGLLATAPRERVTAQRAALIGDAAGLVSPVDGEGISMALASGARLGGILAEVDPADDLSVRQGLRAYSDWIELRVLPQLQRAQRIATWLRNPVVTEQVLAHDGCARYALLASGRMQPLREFIASGS
jgi:flavin-dependent dehydrogenase